MKVVRPKAGNIRRREMRWPASIVRTWPSIACILLYEPSTPKFASVIPFQSTSEAADSALNTKMTALTTKHRDKASLNRAIPVHTTTSIRATIARLSLQLSSPPTSDPADQGPDPAEQGSVIKSLQPLSDAQILGACRDWRDMRKDRPGSPAEQGSVLRLFEPLSYSKILVDCRDERDMYIESTGGLNSRHEYLDIASLAKLWRTTLKNDEPLHQLTFDMRLPQYGKVAQGHYKKLVWDTGIRRDSATASSANGLEGDHKDDHEYEQDGPAYPGMAPRVPCPPDHGRLFVNYAQAIRLVVALATATQMRSNRREGGGGVRFDVVFGQSDGGCPKAREDLTKNLRALSGFPTRPEAAASKLGSAVISP